MDLKKLLRSIFLLAILFGLTNCQKQKTDTLANKNYINEIKEARKAIFFYLNRNMIPGASLAVSKGNKIIYSEGIGLASKDLDVKVDRNTKFRIGSVSELFTSLAYQLMVENGTLIPDSSVQYYSPDFPEKEQKITLEHLVNHTSGIREENSDEKNSSFTNVSLKNGLNRFKNDKLLFPPGNYQSMSMYNYNLLGEIMENAAGKSFEKILSEIVVDTLNLKNTVIEHPFKEIKGRSNFFDHNIIVQVVNATFLDLRYAAPSKGILSNAEDLVKLGNAILNSGYISEDIKSELFTLTKLNTGYSTQLSNGWVIGEDVKGRTYYVRSGDVIGGGASLLIYPEEELVVAGTVNTTMDLEKMPVFEIAQCFLDNEEEETVNSEKQQENSNKAEE